METEEETSQRTRKVTWSGTGTEPGHGTGPMMPAGRRLGGD